MRRKDYVALGDEIINNTAAVVMTFAVLGCFWASYQTLKYGLPMKMVDLPLNGLHKLLVCASQIQR